MTKLYIKNKEDRKLAEDELRTMIDKSGRKIYQSIGHVSKSGMYRTIKNMISYEGELVNIDWRIARVLDGVDDKPDGLGVGGCGMDMGFSIVYNLGSVLWPKGDGVTITGRNGDKDRYFKKLYFIHTKNGARLLHLIPTELKKHRKIIMQEYKDAWWLSKGLHNLSIPRMLHAVLFHCVRKYGWTIGEGKAYQTLYYQIKAKDKKIVRCQGGGRNRINYYLELCKLIPEWQEVKEKYHKEKKNGKENGEEG